MKLEIDRTRLAGAIPSLKSCHSSFNVLLSASDKLLYLTFYDRNANAICHSVPAYVVEEGKVAFNPSTLDKLTKWLKKVGRDCRSLCVEGVAGKELVVKVAGDCAKYVSLSSIESDDLCAPVIFQRTGELAEVPVTLLRDIVSRARTCNSSDAFYAEKLCLSFSLKGTKVAWTDGYLMLLGDYPEGISLESGRVILPLSAVALLLKQADPAEDTVVFGKSSIRCGGLSLSFAEFDEEKQKYPDFSVMAQVIQPHGDTEISFTVEDFREALKRVSAFVKNDVIIRSKIGRGINLLAFCLDESKRFEESPRAEVWFDGAVSAPGEQNGYASAYCVNEAYLKVILAGTTGRIAIRSTDPDSPLYISFENSAIRAVLMPKMTDYLYESV